MADDDFKGLFGLGRTFLGSTDDDRDRLIAMGRKRALAAGLLGAPPAPNAGISTFLGKPPGGGLASLWPYLPSANDPAPTPRLPVTPPNYRGFFRSPPATPPSSARNALVAALLAPPVPVPVRAPAAKPLPLRKVYFAFAFSDDKRVNNVRMQGKIGNSRETTSARGFVDRSQWDRRDIKTINGLKELMRRSMEHSSVVCVLVGTDTHKSRWTKYEIARSVVDKKGLLAVHLNTINNIDQTGPDRLGLSPLPIMGIWRAPNGNHYLVERHMVLVNPATSELGFEWRSYEDFTDPVPSRPRYIPEMALGTVVPLARYTTEYDMVQHGGYQNIWSWIEAAAVSAGR